MKTRDSKPLDKFRNLIREEVKQAIKEEMIPFLLEIIKTTVGIPLADRKVIKEGTAHGNDYLSTLKTPKSKLSNVDSSPISNTPLGILEETRREMLSASGISNVDDYQMTESAPILNETAPVVSSVGEMLRSARKGSKEEFVEISHVPDFTQIMKKLT